MVFSPHVCPMLEWQAWVIKMHPFLFIQIKDVSKQHHSISRFQHLFHHLFFFCDTILQQTLASIKVQQLWMMKILPPMNPTTIVVISFSIIKQVHIWPSIIHDSTNENHIQNKNKNWSSSYIQYIQKQSQES